MNGRRLTALLASAVLASPVAAPQTSLLVGPSPASRPLAARSGAGRTRPPFAPCPTAQLPSLAIRSPRPVPPPRDPALPTVGGEGLATTGLTLPAGVPPPPADKLSATSWVVADLDSGAVLGACGPHELSPPASIQKLLLVAAVMPKLDPAQVIEVTQPDMNFEPGSSAVGLLLGGHYSVETLWLGLLLNSGNDAANVLARLGGGPDGIPGGVKLMNDTAHHLGALDTHAATPSGLDGPGQFTSAYDMALIARECFNRPDFRKYDATQVASIPAQPPQDPRGFQIGNDNQLLYAYPGAIGGKVGFTDLARHTYVGAAERNGRRLVVTLLGAEIQPVRGWQQGVALLDWGFSVPNGASVGRLVDAGETDAKPNPAALSPSAAPVAVLPSIAGHRVDHWLPAFAAGAAVAVVVPLMTLVAIRWRRRPVPVGDGRRQRRRGGR